MVMLKSLSYQKANDGDYQVDNFIKKYIINKLKVKKRPLNSVIFFIII